MTVQTLIKSKPYLLWHVKDKSNVSDDVVVESVLNYGDFSDVKKLIKILGIKKTASIFRRNAKKKRNNFRPEVKNYFELYFKKYA